MKATLTILTLVAVATVTQQSSQAQYVLEPVYADDAPESSDVWVPIYADEVAAAPTPPRATAISPVSAESDLSYAPDGAGKGKGKGGGKVSCGKGCKCPVCMQGIWRSRAFIGVEYLQWWNKGRSLPPLVTGGNPATTPFVAAGVLPGAPILFGGDKVGTDLQGGGRLTAGLWLDDCRTSAFVLRAYGTEGDNTSLTEASFGGDILAIPFNDVSAAIQGENALVVAYSNGLTANIDSQGGVAAQAKNDIYGGDFYFRTLADEGYRYRLDLLGGYQYTQIDDDLSLGTTFTRFDLAGDPQFSTLDSFDVRNEYHAGQLGALAEVYCGPLKIQSLAKIGIGNMRQTVTIDGAHQIVSGGTTTVGEGGIFAQTQAPNGGPSFNIGTYEQDLLVWSPEVGIKAIYCLTDRMSLTVGYTFQYWTRVALAGDQIDRSVNRDVIFGGNFLPGGGDDPQFTFRDTDFWVQTVDIGLLFNY